MRLIDYAFWVGEKWRCLKFGARIQIQNEFGQFPEASDRVFALNKYKRNKKNLIIKGGINIDFD